MSLPLLNEKSVCDLATIPAEVSYCLHKCDGNPAPRYISVGNGAAYQKHAVSYLTCCNGLGSPGLM